MIPELPEYIEQDEDESPVMITPTPNNNEEVKKEFPDEQRQQPFRPVGDSVIARKVGRGDLDHMGPETKGRLDPIE